MRSFKDRNFAKPPQRSTSRPPSSELPPPATPEDVKKAWQQCQDLLNKPQRAGQGRLRARVEPGIAKVRSWMKKFF
jgi:hypothetical protein